MLKAPLRRFLRLEPPAKLLAAFPARYGRPVVAWKVRLLRHWIAAAANLSKRIRTESLRDEHLVRVPKTVLKRGDLTSLAQEGLMPEAKDVFL